VSLLVLEEGATGEVGDEGIGTAALIGYFLVRYLLGLRSYSAGTPGGIFAPLLAVGALWGTVVHHLVHPLVPALGSHSPASRSSG
jgi:CIC family chloride channel protein